MREILEHEKFIVHTANNGIEALDVLQKDMFDIILMDIQMPEMDGFTATKEIKKIESEQRNIPIIALTASALKKRKEECLEIGMDDYVSKPVEFQTLFKVLAKWIKPMNRKIPTFHKNDSPEDTAFPEIIPGIDVKLGLQKVFGNNRVFKKILFTFHSRNKKVVEVIRDLYEKNDFHKIKKIIHTIKGVSGNICAKELYEASVELESALINESNNLELHLNVFEQRLKRVLQSINTLIEKDIDESKNQKNIDLNQTADANESFPTKEEISKLQALLDKLEFLIEDDISEAENHLNTIMDVCIYPKLQSKIKTIQEHLENYDPDSALAVFFDLKRYIKKQQMIEGENNHEKEEKSE